MKPRELVMNDESIVDGLTALLLLEDIESAEACDLLSALSMITGYIDQLHAGVERVLYAIASRRSGLARGQADDRRANWKMHRNAASAPRGDY